MANGFVITITDEDDEVLHNSWLREQYGAEALSDTIAKHVARFIGKIFAANKITITVLREAISSVPELPAAGNYGGGYDDDIL